MLRKVEASHSKVSSGNLKSNLATALVQLAIPDGQRAAIVVQQSNLDNV